MNSPQHSDLLILQNAKATYLLWHNWLNHLPKTSRFTVGKKIDDLFIRLLESLYLAGYAPKPDKIKMINQVINANDLLKFFLRLIWEMNFLTDNKFRILGMKLEEIGRLAYGWKNKSEKTPPPEAVATKSNAGGQGQNANCR